MQLQPYGCYFHKKKLSLQHAMQMQRGIMLELYPSSNFGTRLGWMGNAMPRPLYPQVIAPVCIVQETVRVGLDNYRKSHPHRVSNTGLSSL